MKRFANKRYICVGGLVGTFFAMLVGLEDDILWGFRGDSILEVNDVFVDIEVCNSELLRGIYK